MKGARPGVLVVHDWMGLGDFAKAKADALARLGYTAFAADVYGKGVRPANGKEAGAEAGKYKADRALLRARMTAAFDTLVARKDLVDATRVGSIGFCFGGTAALELARSGAKVAATVSFHGGLDSKTPADAKQITGTVLALHGADDPYVPPAEVAGFMEEMRAAKVDWQLVAYGGAVHAFTNQAAGSDPSKGAAYQAKADARSWDGDEGVLHRGLRREVVRARPRRPRPDRAATFPFRQLPFARPASRQRISGAERIVAGSRPPERPMTRWIVPAIPLFLLALSLSVSAQDRGSHALPPGDLGPYNVGTDTFGAILTGGRATLVQVFYPTLDAADCGRKYTIRSPAGPYQVTSPFGAVEDAEVAPGRFPLIVYDHGAPVAGGDFQRVSQAPLHELLASHGFVVFVALHSASAALAPAAGDRPPSRAWRRGDLHLGLALLRLPAAARPRVARASRRRP